VAVEEQDAETEVVEEQGTEGQRISLQKRNKKTKGGTGMKVTDFTSKVTRIEGGKVKISVAQVAEVLKIANKLLSGKLYKLIKLL
jgi:hypothetical protein